MKIQKRWTLLKPLNPPRPKASSLAKVFQACVLFMTPVVIYSLSSNAFAQVPADASLYRSEVDNRLTIRSISLLPFTDNAKGIYSRPIEDHIKKLLSESHRWDFLPAENFSGLHTAADLKENQQLAKSISERIKADSFLMGKIVQGPAGMSIQLSLFLKKDQKLLAESGVKKLSSTGLPELKGQASKILNQIYQAIPYSGHVLSRQGKRVTLNLGTKDGVKKNQILTVIQIIKERRHPKFQFLVSTEKEIVGRVKVLKADQTLSFGMITSEREAGAIGKHSKIGPLNFVEYGDPSSLGDPSDQNFSSEPGSDSIYGKDPKEWKPKKEPSFGQVGARLGFGSTSQNLQLSGADSLKAQSNFTPSIFLEAELWLTPKWTMHANLRQSIITMNNPRSGGSPDELSGNLSYYELLAGYTMRAGPRFWDPYAEIFMGYFDYRLFVDASSPEAFPTSKYSGLKFGVRGMTPIARKSLWFAGGQVSFTYKPNLSETPISSGSSSANQVNQFGVFAFKKVSSRIKLQFQMDYELYSSNFSGAGSRSVSATSGSQKHLSLSGGVYYLF